MQPDHGENPCTPNTLIRILPERVGEPTRRTSPFFLAFFPTDRGGPSWSGGTSPPRRRYPFRKAGKVFAMFNFKTGLAAGALSMALALTSVIPAQAVTFARVPVPEASAVEKVQYRYERRDRRDRYERRTDRRWHGHRGYRDYRPGYRRHSDGWWYPLAAFGLGAAIGGAIANQPQAGGGSHTRWCANRYRSYRAYDNTFQPYNGPRQQCVSPYS